MPRIGPARGATFSQRWKGHRSVCMPIWRWGHWNERKDNLECDQGRIGEMVQLNASIPTSALTNLEITAEGDFHWHLNFHKHLHAECLRKFAPHLCDNISSRGIRTWGSSSSPRELHSSVRKIFVQWKQRPTYKPAQIPCALRNIFALVSTHNRHIDGHLPVAWLLIDGPHQGAEAAWPEEVVHVSVVS